MRTRAIIIALALALAACSSAVGTPGPTEEGAFLDEGATADEVDGLFMQCGNALQTNFYWMVQDRGPSKMFSMPVVCIGPLTTPGFDSEDAEPVGDRFGFPAWDEEIAALCAEACLEANDPATGQTPTCDVEAFSPNLVWGDWQPGDGNHCDSTLPSLHGRDITETLP